MFKILQILALISFITAQYVIRPYEAPNQGRIVGGTTASIESRPFQVSIQFNNNHFCGGSIIAPNQILTAAHCINPNTVPKYQIRAGSAAWRNGGVTMGVKNATIHPKFNSTTNDYDVAILWLTGNLTFNNKIQPVNIPSMALVPPPDAMLGVSGWGTMRSTAIPMSPTLRSAMVPVVNAVVCESWYGQENITARMLCAGKPGKDFCYGDDGGPLTFGKYVVGVVSFGNGCGDKNYPGVYANVSALVNSTFQFM